MKWIIRILIVIALIAGAGYFFRQDIFLAAVERVMKRQFKVGPHQGIDWNRSDVTANRDDDSRPNIVLILADDLGWNDITVGGGGVADGTVPTPHIDSIGSEGIQFTNGYSGHSTCAPSRAAMMSGRYSTRFGFETTPTPEQGAIKKILPFVANPLISNSPKGVPKVIHYSNRKGDKIPFEDKGMPAEEITIAETLKQVGYHTVHIGKWHLGRSNGMAPEDQGFNESLLMHSGLYLPEDHPNVVNAGLEHDFRDRMVRKAFRYAASFNNATGDAFEPGGYITDYYTDEAVKVIEANKNRPFFLYLAHWAPHRPLQATKADYDALSHIKNHQLRVYAAMIRALDRGVGRVMEALKANGIDDNTMVIFTSDNGGSGALGLPDVNQPYRGWKLTFFEGGVHVPYFIRWPARIRPGSILEAPVHQFDIYSTATGAVGAAMPKDRIIDGVNLLDFIPGVDGSAPAKQGQHPHEKLFWRASNVRVVLADGWKFLQDNTQGKSWLFDLKNDPTEQNNLAAKEPERVREMEAMLARHNAEQKPPAWPISVEAPVRVDKTKEDPFEPSDEYIYYAN